MNNQPDTKDNNQSSKTFLRLRTVTLALLIVAVIGVGAYYVFAPTRKSSSITDDNAVAVTADHTKENYNTSRVDQEVIAWYAEVLDVPEQVIKNFLTILVEQKVPDDQWDAKLSATAAQYKKYVKELVASDQVVNSFLTILLEQKVPSDQWGAKLWKMETSHKELLIQLEIEQPEAQHVFKLKQAARQAIEVADYAKAEDLLNRAEASGISVAETNADQAQLQRLQLHYAKAAEYWQKAASLLPEESKKKRASYMHETGDDLASMGSDSEALSLYEQSLSIYKEIDNRYGKIKNLRDISKIYSTRGDDNIALEYMDQLLGIYKKMGYRDGEIETLSKIILMYQWGDYDTALKYLKQLVDISREEGDQYERILRHNIMKSLPRDNTALKYMDQLLSIYRETGDQKKEINTLEFLAETAVAAGDFTTEVRYLEQLLSIYREMGDQDREIKILNDMLDTAFMTSYAKLDFNNATVIKYGEQLLTIYRKTGDREGEIKCGEQLLSMYRETGDREKEIEMIQSLVQIAAIMGADDNYATFFKYQEQLLSIYQENGDREKEIKTLEFLVQTTTMMGLMGDNASALKYQEQLLNIYREVGNREGEIKTLNSLLKSASMMSYAKLDLNNATVIKYGEQLLSIYRKSNDRDGEIKTLSTLVQSTTVNDGLSIIGNATSLKYLEQLQSIYRETGDRDRELGNLRYIWWIDYSTALKYLKPFLNIDPKSGDKVWGMLLNRDIMWMQPRDYTLKYLESVLAFSREIGDPGRESEVLANIGHVYHDLGHAHNNSDEFATSVKYLEQSLAIIQKMGGWKKEEAYTCWDIGMTCNDLGDLRKAEQYISRAVEIGEDVKHPKLKEWRKDLKKVQSSIKAKRE